MKDIENFLFRLSEKMIWAARVSNSPLSSVFVRIPRMTAPFPRNETKLIKVKYGNFRKLLRTDVTFDNGRVAVLVNGNVVMQSEEPEEIKEGILDQLLFALSGVDFGEPNNVKEYETDGAFKHFFILPLSAAEKIMRYVLEIYDRGIMSEFSRHFPISASSGSCVIFWQRGHMSGFPTIDIDNGLKMTIDPDDELPVRPHIIYSALKISIGHSLEADVSMELSHDPGNGVMHLTMDRYVTKVSMNSSKFRDEFSRVVSGIVNKGIVSTKRMIRKIKNKEYESMHL